MLVISLTPVSGMPGFRGMVSSTLLTLIDRRPNSEAVSRCQRILSAPIPPPRTPRPRAEEPNELALTPVRDRCDPGDAYFHWLGARGRSGSKPHRDGEAREWILQGASTASRSVGELSASCRHVELVALHWPGSGRP